ncbi:MAG: hypothetical protein DDT36_00281 [Firmicutes bacterium]|nr:hypothetical protein [Bacillota bacterium]
MSLKVGLPAPWPAFIVVLAIEYRLVLQAVILLQVILARYFLGEAILGVLPQFSESFFETFGRRKGQQVAFAADSWCVDKQGSCRFVAGVSRSLLVGSFTPSYFVSFIEVV